MEKEGKEAEKNDGPKPDVTRNLGLRIDSIEAHYEVLFGVARRISGGQLQEKIRPVAQGDSIALL